MRPIESTHSEQRVRAVVISRTYTDNTVGDTLDGSCLSETPATRSGMQVRSRGCWQREAHAQGGVRGLRWKAAPRTHGSRQRFAIYGDVPHIGELGRASQIRRANDHITSTPRRDARNTSPVLAGGPDWLSEGGIGIAGWTRDGVIDLARMGMASGTTTLLSMNATTGAMQRETVLPVACDRGAVSFAPAARRAVCLATERRADVMILDGVRP